MHYSYADATVPSAEFIDGTLSGMADLPVSPTCALFRIADLRESFVKRLPTRPPFDLRRTGAGTDILMFLLTAERYPNVACIQEPLAFFRAHPVR